QDQSSALETKAHFQVCTTSALRSLYRAGSYVGQDFCMGQDPSVEQDLCIGQDPIMGQDLCVGQDPDLGQDLCMGHDPSMGQDPTWSRIPAWDTIPVWERIPVRGRKAQSLLPAPWGGGGRGHSAQQRLHYTPGNGAAPWLLNKHCRGGVCFMHNIQGVLAAVQKEVKDPAAICCCTTRRRKGTNALCGALGCPMAWGSGAGRR
uniref:Uncharacterized protein n=1 Tax=Meleagris gallopavo TaxID=9103 RepID=A0A803Y5B9_MELGA